jgi:hypothetical protein
MITRQRLALAVRRERLLMRADQQREVIADQAAALAGPIGLADKALVGVRWVRGNPVVLVIGLIAAVALRPRGMLGLGTGGLRIWAAWRALRTSRTRVVWALLPRVFDLLRGLRSRRP